MKRAIIDLRSVLWTAIMAGKDKEGGRKVIFNDKEVHINSAEYGYDNALDHILLVLDDLDIQPRDVILVDEGKNAKLMRTQMFAGYKAGREQCEDQYVEFNKAKEMLVSALLNVGASMCWQENMEADDVIGYLAKNLKGERWVVSNDGDLAVCIGDGAHLWQRGARDVNPFGPFSPRFIPVYKALVGDSSDKYPGAYKFGEAAWNKLLDTFGEEGLELLEGLIIKKRLLDLGEDVAEVKELQRVIDGADMVYTSYALAKLYIEKVNVMRRPLQWRVGMVKPYDGEDRLRSWHSQVRLVHAGNYGQAVEWAAEQIRKSPYVTLDLETSVDDLSEEWLERRSKKGGGVDVMGSKITGCGLTFGENGQYTFYISVDHADTDNCTLDQLMEFLEAIPSNKVTLAQNAAGFEIPVMLNAFGEAWKNNGWRGCFPNLHDTRIAANYVDENRHTFGLKDLSRDILGYEQENYEHVTTKWVKTSEYDGFTGMALERNNEEDTVRVQYRMNQLTAKQVLSYGADDTICTAALWAHFVIRMEIDGTLDTFLTLEQKPMYLSALSFVAGTRIDMPRLMDIAKRDEATYEVCRKTLDEYLIEKGWDGTVTPVYSELTAAAIKEIFLIVTGRELKTMVRTPDKLIKLVEVEGENLLAAVLASGDFDSINKLVASKYANTPIFDTASPKQVQKLLYEVMGLPIRLRNKATDVMRAKGIREGTPRTDDDTILMAIKQGDAEKGTPEEKALTALVQIKSIDTKRGLYYDPYPKFLHPVTGKLHPEIRQSTTNTRRWTGANPNLQQTSKSRDGVRAVILPHHRKAVVVSLDQVAQEVRIMADQSKDKNLLACYLGSKEELKDIHSFVSAMVTRQTYESFLAKKNSKDEVVASAANDIRNKSKSVFFGQAYGALAPKIAEQLGIETSEAQAYLDAIYAAFPDLGKWKQDVEAKAEMSGVVRTYRKAVRHLGPALLSDNSYERSKALRQAVNTIIQSSGAEQMKTVMTRIWDSRLIEDYDFQWMFCLHDEIVVSVGREDAAHVIKALYGFMTEQFLDVVPSASSIGLGKNFGELVELGEVFDAEKIEETLSDIFDEREVLAA
jgi:DNA polymerase I-like protein with 3'-5' exonuclease and polymerase domains/5'-3' exonuclease